jgi:hypothetical protein
MENEGEELNYKLEEPARVYARGDASEYLR